MQKAAYFLQELLGVPTGFEFILYKHGPYSFDLTEDLTALRADYLITFDHKSPGYGPGIVPTGTSRQFRSRYPTTLGRHEREIEFVARILGRKGVTELEKLATALFVTREPDAALTPEGRARRLVALKPHVPVDQARDAIRELDRIVREAEDWADQEAP